MGKFGNRKQQKNAESNILTLLKVMKILKIERVWLKSQACHFYFELKGDVTRSILQLQNFFLKILNYEKKFSVWVCFLHLCFQLIRF